jgi:alpha-tubulin suppressor-like RCC1 family protein
MRHDDTATDTIPFHPTRRTVLTGAAWAIPAIALTAATPAFAASNSALITVSTPQQQIVATGATTVTARVTTAAGAPAAGKAVSFTAPSGASVTPSVATTDGNGVATAQVDLGTPWRTPGSTAIVTATVGSDSTSQPLTVLGANALAAGAWLDEVGGPGSNAARLTLQQIELAFPSPIAQIASSTVILLRDGTVWTRGWMLGDGSESRRRAWGIVPHLTDVIQISAGEESRYAVRSDGSVWAWGSNSRGQLGSGTTTDASVPKRVTNLSNVTQLRSGDTTVYALVGGAVYAWGQNDLGQVGNGNTTDVTSPVQIIPSGVTQIAPNLYRCAALKSDGTVLIWGRNYTSSPSPFAGISGVTALGAATGTYYARMTDGSAQSWLTNSYGQGGNGDTTTSLTPRPIVGLTSGVHVLAGNGISNNGSRTGAGYAWMNDGSLRSWGSNLDGQLGDGTTDMRTSPVTPALPAGTPPVAAMTDVYGDIFAVVVKPD